jgi:hypothetical protein
LAISVGPLRRHQPHFFHGKSAINGLFGCGDCGCLGVRLALNDLASGNGRGPFPEVATDALRQRIFNLSIFYRHGPDAIVTARRTPCTGQCFILTERWGARCVPPASSSGLPPPASDAVMGQWSIKSQEVIYGGRIIGAKIRAQGARQAAQKAVREADRAAAELMSIQMEAHGGPAQPSPTIGQCLNGGYGWLQVKCHRCDTGASIPLDAIRRPRDTPIWKLEAALKCRSCRKGRYAPSVHMIKLTETRRTNPYRWVHPDNDDRR